jgi:hypothetical protein
MKRFGLLFIFVALCFQFCLAGELLVTRAYSLQTADPSSIIEVVQATVGENGNVKYDKASNRLIVSATEAQQKDIAGFIRELDAQPRNVQIEVRTQTANEEQESNAGVDIFGSISAKDLKPGEQIKIKPHAQDRVTRNGSLDSQLLVAASGREAALRIVTDTAFVEWLLEYGQRWGYLADNIIRKDIGAKLWIQPIILGNGPFISIKLIPEISFVVDGHRQLIRYVRVSMEVTVRDGQPITIAGKGEIGDFYNRFLSGAGGTTGTGSTTMTLIPKIMPAFPRSSQ